MKYKTMDDIFKGLYSRMKALPDGLSSKQAIAWYAADAETQHLANLNQVYQSALHSAPQPYVGVGRISYAEQMLQQAQNNA